MANLLSSGCFRLLSYYGSDRDTGIFAYLRDGLTGPRALSAHETLWRQRKRGLGYPFPVLSLSIHGDNIVAMDIGRRVNAGVPTFFNYLADGILVVDVYYGLDDPYRFWKFLEACAANIKRVVFVHHSLEGDAGVAGSASWYRDSQGEIHYQPDNFNEGYVHPDPKWWNASGASQAVGWRTVQAYPLCPSSSDRVLVTMMVQKLTDVWHVSAAARPSPDFLLVELPLLDDTDLSFRARVANSAVDVIEHALPAWAAAKVNELWNVPTQTVLVRKSWASTLGIRISQMPVNEYTLASLKAKAQRLVSDDMEYTLLCKRFNDLQKQSLIVVAGLTLQVWRNDLNLRASARPYYMASRSAIPDAQMKTLFDQPNASSGPFWFGCAAFASLLAFGGMVIGRIGVRPLLQCVKALSFAFFRFPATAALSVSAIGDRCLTGLTKGAAFAGVMAAEGSKYRSTRLFFLAEPWPPTSHPDFPMYFMYPNVLNSTWCVVWRAFLHKWMSGNDLRTNLKRHYAWNWCSMLIPMLIMSTCGALNPDLRPQVGTVVCTHLANSVYPLFVAPLVEECLKRAVSLYVWTNFPFWFGVFEGVVNVSAWCVAMELPNPYLAAAMPSAPFVALAAFSAFTGLYQWYRLRYRLASLPEYQLAQQRATDREESECLALVGVSGTYWDTSIPVESVPVTYDVAAHPWASDATVTYKTGAELLVVNEHNVVSVAESLDNNSRGRTWWAIAMNGPAIWAPPKDCPFACLVLAIAKCAKQIAVDGEEACHNAEQVWASWLDAWTTLEPVFREFWLPNRWEIRPWHIAALDWLEVQRSNGKGAKFEKIAENILRLVDDHPDLVRSLKLIRCFGKHDEVLVAKLGEWMMRPIDSVAPLVASITGVIDRELTSVLKKSGSFEAYRWADFEFTRGFYWFPCLGWSQDHLSESFQFMVDNGGIALWAHGDDTLLVCFTSLTILVLEADLSACDRSFGSPAFGFHFKWMTLMMRSFCDESCEPDSSYGLAMAAKRAIVEAKRQFGDFIVKFHMGGVPLLRQATGSTATSLANTIYVSVPYLVAAVNGSLRSFFSGEYDFWAYGQKVKTKHFELSYDPIDWPDVFTFLKGFWTTNTSGGWVWVRLPSFLLKFFKSRRPFKEIPGICRKREALSEIDLARRFLAMTAKGWAPYQHLPGIDSFIDVWASKWEADGIAPDIRVSVPRAVQGLGMEVWRPLCGRYGLTTTDIVCWLNRLLLIDAGDVFNSNVWWALGADYY
jgi:uncharacterized protein (DUF2249 family)